MQANLYLSKWQFAYLILEEENSRVRFSKKLEETSAGEQVPREELEPRYEIYVALRRNARKLLLIAKHTFI